MVSISAANVYSHSAEFSCGAQALAAGRLGPRLLTDILSAGI